MANLSITNYNRPQIELPDNRKRLLLHACCVVCAGEIIEALLAGTIEFAVYFYNPNIDTAEEYERRLEALQRFCSKTAVPLIEGAYESQLWQSKAGFAGAGPEGQERCTLCFDMRLQNTANYAERNGYDIFATTLGISRWKNIELINQTGQAISENRTNIGYWDKNWRKNGGSQRMHELAKKHEFYRQNYCGCTFSQTQQA